MRPIRAVLMTATLLMAAACDAVPAGTTGDADQTSESSEPAAGTSTAASPSLAATPTPEGIPGVPDDAELQARYERLIAALTPPQGAEVARESPGPLDLGVFFETTEPLDSLVSFYDTALPAAGLEIVGFDDPFPDNRTWDFEAGDQFFGGVSISRSEGGYRVLISMLGIPPAG